MDAQGRSGIISVKEKVPPVGSKVILVTDKFSALGYLDEPDPAAGHAVTHLTARQLMSTPATTFPRLLIVDDEAPQMQALCDTLKQEGYATSGFTSATLALKTPRAERFDLVLTDLMMTGI